MSLQLVQVLTNLKPGKTGKNLLKRFLKNTSIVKLKVPPRTFTIFNMETKHIIRDTPQERKRKRLNRIERAALDMLQALEAVVDYFGDTDSLLADQCRSALAKAKPVKCS